MKRVYISGKITGEDENKCRLKFKEADEKISAEGNYPVNPLDVYDRLLKKFPVDDLTYDFIMKMDIKELMSCDEIYLLKDWQQSSGANLERFIALSLNMPLRYEDESTMRYTAIGRQ